MGPVIEISERDALRWGIREREVGCPDGTMLSDRQLHEQRVLHPRALHVPNSMPQD